MADVVAVADPGQTQAPEIPVTLPEREEVGQRLARVLLIGERVHHGIPAGQLVHGRLGEGPGRDRVDPPAEVPGDVGDRLPRPSPMSRPARYTRPPRAGPCRPRRSHGSGATASRTRAPASGRRAASWRRGPSSGPSTRRRGGTGPRRRAPRDPRSRGGASRLGLPEGIPHDRHRAIRVASSTMSGGVMEDLLARREDQEAPVAARVDDGARRSSSMPTRRPLPRTSRIAGTVAASAPEPSDQVRPSPDRRSGSRSSSIVVKVATPTVVAKGFPPNVVPWVPAISTLAHASRATIAPIGIPLARAFASASRRARRPSAGIPRDGRSVPCRSGSRRT